MSKDTDFDSNKKVDGPLEQKKRLTTDERLERIENSLVYPRQKGRYGSYDSDEDEIDLGQLISVIWRGKFKIFATALLFAIASVFYALSLPNIYSSTLKLVPTDQESENGLSSLASKYGGLASMAGINIGGGGNASSIEHAIELMKSWPYIDSFVEKHKLKVIFMATKGWNVKTNTLVYDEEIYDAKSNEWRSGEQWFNDETVSFEPSSYKTYEKIKKEFMSVNFDDEIGVFSITVNHYSPQVAYEIVNKLKDDINEYFKQEAKKEALASIAFLESKIENTTNAQMLEVFYSMIESHTQKVMMTEVNQEYLVKTLVRAKTAEPDVKSKPKRAVIVLLATMFGGFIGVFFVLFLNFRNVKEV